MTAKKKRQTVDPKTGRFQSVLTRELLERLCEVHAEGDFRNVTAARCQVHPKLLTRWLKLGAGSEEAGLATELFMRFIALEGDKRAGYIAELEDTTASTEETAFEDGKPVSKTVTTRRTHGIQWLMERRFRQFRVEHVLTEDEQDALSLLQPQPQAMTTEMAFALCQQMAANPQMLPEPIRALFASTDWRAPQLKESHGQEN